MQCYDVTPQGYLSRASSVFDDRQNGTLGPIPGDELGRQPGCSDHYDRGHVTLQRQRHGADAQRVGRTGFRFGLNTRDRVVENQTQPV